MAIYPCGLSVVAIAPWQSMLQRSLIFGKRVELDRAHFWFSSNTIQPAWYQAYKSCINALPDGWVK